MELQLGLAPPSNDSHNNVRFNKGLDLNCSYVHEANNNKELVGLSQVTSNFMLQAGSAMSSTNDDNSTVVSSKKRCFGDAFEEGTSSGMPRILSLLLWNNQPNEEDDDHLRNLDNNRIEGDSVVGWPPVKLSRRKVNCQQNYDNRSADDNNRTVDNGCIEFLGRTSNSMYVKVKMEGAAIARKIDLSLHHSFPTLKQTLLGMFATRQEKWNSYVLLYQDREGDWLPAEGVSWRRFIRTVQRLKLVRNSG